MKEEGGNWFAKWESELPAPEELMPLSQTLISPDLAMAFDIRSSPIVNETHQGNLTPPPQSAGAVMPSPNSHPQPNSSADFGADSSDLGSGGAGDEPARTLKRPRLVWTPQLHKRFVDAVGHLGIKNAVPKTIMQLMSVDGLTRENVASHLQKYRLYLKRMQGLSAGGVGGASQSLGLSDPASEHLFANSHVPPHFLHPGRPSADHFLPYVPVAALQQHHNHHSHHNPPQMAHLQSHFHRQMGQLDHTFLRQNPPGQHRVHKMEEVESAAVNGGRKVLTLFPTGND